MRVGEQTSDRPVQKLKVAYFKHITVFEVPYAKLPLGAWLTHFIDEWISDTATKHK